MELALNILEWLVGLAAIGWFIWWRLQKDESGPWGFVIKSAATLVIGFVFVRFGVAWFREGELVAVAGLGVGMSCALAIGVIWRNDILVAIASPFSGLYEDTQELKPKPYYAKAEAQRMAGDFRGAIAEVKAELEKFPQDFEGHMRLAALLAEHSEDLPGALRTIEAAVALPELAPGQIGYALNTAADWEIKYARNPAGARRALERLVALVPDTETEAHAQQRLIYLPSEEMLVREDNRQPIAIPEFSRKLGLRRRTAAPAAPKLDINAEEKRLQDRLKRNARDWAAREELAVLYVEQFEFFERGVQELETLIVAPGQPQRDIVRLLHMKADWQVKLFNDVEAGRATLKRIQELFPNSAAAARATVAMMHLQPQRKFEKKKAEE